MQIPDQDIEHAERVRRIATARTNDFMELVRIAGLDPAIHFRFADWSGVDFSGCNLRGFDFTGARLHGCRFDGALIGEGSDIDGKPAAAARFDLAELGAVSHEREPGSHAPAIMTPLADVTTAADWAAYAAGWRRAGRQPARQHLPVGSIFSDAPAFAPQMVVVPSGRFTMGSPHDEPERIGMGHRHAKTFGAEEPRREIMIERPFAVGRLAVTRGQFAAFVAATGHNTPDGMFTYEQEGRKWGVKQRKGRSWRNPSFGQDDSHPVVGVGWKDARAYCAWLSEATQKTYRLLSEAEWEYVARAGTTSAFWWGNEITPARANYDGNYVYKGGGAKGEWRKVTVPANAFDANPWGLHNVHGNTYEWCEDLFHDSYDKAPIDGSPWLKDGVDGRRVMRGGSWSSYPRGCRSASRDKFATVNRYSGLSFRLARALNP